MTNDKASRLEVVDILTTIKLRNSGSGNEIMFRKT